MKTAVDINQLDVIFGSNIRRTTKKLDQGYSRQQIIDELGDVVAVNSASLQVKQGQICVLMGLSGSGKSSLLRAVNGLNSISRGSVKIRDNDQMIDLAHCNGATLRHLRTNRVSMVFQKFALMPWLTVLENVAFGLELKGMSKQQREQKALEQLEMVGLSEWSNQYPHELSGGMQQRVGLARAFAMDSDILLMDEPFSALDPLIRTQLQDELLALQRKLNKTIIFVSHDLDEALKLGNKIAIMESGKIIQYGEPEEIVLKPTDDYVEEFVAHTNPLNVLRGLSLMTSLTQLPQENNQIVIKPHEETRLKLADDGSIDSVWRKNEALEMVTWQESDGFDAISFDQVVVTDPDINMRDALELRYRSGQPIMLCNDKKLIGVLNDKDFYHALLGKHFSHSN
ncbi:MAG: Vitamin B12 import ATP-binding protein BtuD [Candidatus Celerinatantimonas neptuna]|nr:MAG: Vitamin B12 import ATP-binding protein BtuD [Candidatus Celerinatantimonas neptuna]